MYVILVGILSILIFSIKNMAVGWGGVLLNGLNLLSVTKVICRQSLRNFHTSYVLPRHLFIYLFIYLFVFPGFVTLSILQTEKLLP